MVFRHQKTTINEDLTMPHNIPAQRTLTKEDVTKEIVNMAERGEPGRLSTTMCEVIGVSFENFLKFSQLDKDAQLVVIRKLASILELSN